MLKTRYFKMHSPFEIFGDTMILIFLLLVCAITIYPFLFIIHLSMGGTAYYADSKLFSIKNFALDSYLRVVESRFFVWGFVNTIKRVTLGTSLTVCMLVLGAYPLSKRYLPNRTFWTAFFVFTMFFGGGLIPNYMLIKSLNMMNTIWALVLPGLVPTFSMLIMRNFFMEIPESLEESARLDGANDFQIVLRIILPISLPILATVTLWSMVGHWNSWFDSMIYMREPKNQVLQVVLRNIVVVGTTKDLQAGGRIDRPELNTPEAIKAATIVVGTVPIVLVYPFLQKYFVKGILVGSLKG